MLRFCNNGIYFIFMSNNSLSKSRCLRHTVQGQSLKEIWLTSLLSSPMSQFNLHQMTRKIYCAQAFFYDPLLLTSNAFCKICYFFCLEHITFLTTTVAFVSNIILRCLDEKSIFNGNMFLVKFAVICFSLRFYSINSKRIFFHQTFSRSLIDKIDQSEFDGFEYINPLLMSAEDVV